MTEQQVCEFCLGTGWERRFEQKTDDGALHGWVPCADHGRPEFPDYLETELADTPPVLGVHYVREEGTCIAGRPAINGYCNDAKCRCGPPIDYGVTRIRVDDEEQIYIVQGDNDRGDEYALLLNKVYDSSVVIKLDPSIHRKIDLFEHRITLVGPVAWPHRSKRLRVIVGGREQAR